MFLNIIVMAFFSRRRQQPLESLTNEALIKEFNKGRADAFALIINRLERPLFLYILKRVQNEEMARDILQDTFMRLTQHAHRYDDKSPLTAWLYTIARNRSIDYLRKKKHKEISIDAPLKGEDNFTLHNLLKDQSPDSSDIIAGEEFAQRLDVALDQINPDQKKIFILREIHGLKFVEIAEFLELSENTVKSRMRYALDSLRKQLSDFMPHLAQTTNLSEEEHR